MICKQLQRPNGIHCALNPRLIASTHTTRLARRGATSTTTPYASTTSQTQNRTKNNSTNSSKRILRDPKDRPPQSSSSASTSRMSNIAQTLQSRASRTTETYTAYGATKKMFEACQLQADYKIPQALQPGAEVPKTANGEDLGVGEGAWYKDLSLLPTFSTWSQITFLHMYLLTVRLRTLPSPESFRTYSQHLLDAFSHNAEHRMTIYHGMTMRGIRNRYLKDLFIQWRGVLAAYDQGLVEGDAVLGAAVWRNLWKAGHTVPVPGKEGEVQGEAEIDWEKVAVVVAYMRRVLVALGRVSDVDLVHAVNGTAPDGSVQSIFGLSGEDWQLVRGVSKGMIERVEQAESDPAGNEKS
ncbi:hypothetical protein AJ79_02835 [Helicocarpus griseus UAMH5409]|uniref:Ubiquinol-cytochrome c chaperone domain-containing protein n=1 Tax=Helicocarpus griseus UAMH5409 TaxID=1447875 RepID=A0A2B7Y0X6_9EURO|nr:hypothetical protein AJ79_02835 [Helicocarpus griseus UAMH5409]